MESASLIQIILPIITIFVAIIAIAVPACISHKQNKIALFKERFSVYNTVLTIQNNSPRANSIFQSRIATQKIKHSSEWKILFVEIMNVLFEDKTISTLVEDFEKHIKTYYTNFLRDFDQVDMNQVYYESDWLFFDPDDIGPDDNENLLSMRNKLYMDIFWEVKRISSEITKVKFIFNSNTTMSCFFDYVHAINTKIIYEPVNNDDIISEFNKLFLYIEDEDVYNIEREILIKN